MTAPAAERAAATPRPSRRLVIAAACVVALLAGVAFLRGGLLGLPSVPRGVTGQDAGLADIAAMRARAAQLDGGAPAAGDEALRLAQRGQALVRQGSVEAGLDTLRAAVLAAPHDLVIGNAYRMEIFALKRAALADTSTRTTLAETLPPAIAHEPFALFERMRREQPSREATLQLALAWVDELLLFHALEIAAPASVSSVDLFSEILATHPDYVPALYGRGLNYLHRPARLVWPESHKAAPDAASHDIGLAVAIGRKIGGASPRLVGTLALALGDSYAKEGRLERARSWWQIAQNADRDPGVRSAVRQRLAWRNAEVRDRLEDELERRMLDIDHPLTDLALMWR